MGASRGGPYRTERALKPPAFVQKGRADFLGPEGWRKNLARRSSEHKLGRETFGAFHDFPGIYPYVWVAWSIAPCAAQPHAPGKATYAITRQFLQNCSLTAGDRWGTSGTTTALA